MTNFLINYETKNGQVRSVTVTDIDAAHAKAVVLDTIVSAKKIINCTRLKKSRR